MESLRRSDALKLVPPASAPAPEPAAVWSPVQRILFRFVFAYLFLYIFPFPLDLIAFIPHAGVVLQPYYDLWNAVIPWVGKHVFHVSITVQPNGSGDTTYNYVQLFCYLVIALAATAVWTLLDRKRTNYRRLHEWLRLWVRFSLGTAMLSYGGYKVIKSQFPSPGLDRLLQPFGDSSPMGLLWTFMGASTAYTFFAGASEVVGGLLLAARRTALLGALVTIAVMGNIVMLNYSYDVPVKLYSSHLLLMAVFVAAPDLRRLVSFFVLNRTAEPVEMGSLFKRTWARRSALVFQIVFVIGYLGLALYQSYDGRRQYGDGAPRSPLRGVWNVEVMEVNGQVRPPVFTEATRWRRVVFDFPGALSIQLMSDSRLRFNLLLDPVKKSMALARRDDPEKKSAFSYQRPESDLLVMEGTMDGQKIRARLRQTNVKSFQLTSRGFHWISEYPFNR
jgi:hypothetical protein